MSSQNLDPLDVLLAEEHANESEEQRAARVEEENVAKALSNRIDKALNEERANRKHSVKILLLGQSESGKSTTLKNFQLMHQPSLFRTERASWRAIIQLNVVRSIGLIVDAMTRAQPPPPTSPKSPHTTNSGSLYPTLTSEHLRLKLRLAPLASLEQTLLHKLNPCEETTTRYLSPLSERLANVPEPVVNSSAPWKGAFNRILSGTGAGMASWDSFDSNQMVDWDDPRDPGVVLHACSEDMIRLWNDPTIKQLLEIEKLRLEDMAGFFLDSLDRVTSKKYVPSDSDILRARLKTLGVSEFQFRLKQTSTKDSLLSEGRFSSPKSTTGSTVTHDYRVFDVGGQRSLRAAWAPYFDDVDSIIFLAPISCVDQVLAEAPTVNRLEDSFLLWTSIVENPLLASASLVLFLNKCDILQAKLNGGLRLNKYITSYGKRPNTFEDVSTYLKKQFAAIVKSAQAPNAPVRSLYCHLTSVTDMEATTRILDSVQDMLILRNLKEVSLIV